MKVIGASETDFSYWEQRYGRKLPEIEKLAIKCELLGLPDVIEKAYEGKPDYSDGL